MHLYIYIKGCVEKSWFCTHQQKRNREKRDRTLYSAYCSIEKKRNQMNPTAFNLFFLDSKPSSFLWNKFLFVSSRMKNIMKKIIIDKENKNCLPWITDFCSYCCFRCGCQNVSIFEISLMSSPIKSNYNMIKLMYH